MIGLGKAIAAAITYIIGFIVFKQVLADFGTSGWSPMAIAMITAVPVVILAVGVGAMLIRPSAYKEQAKILKQNTRKF